VLFGSESEFVGKASFTNTISSQQDLSKLYSTNENAMLAVIEMLVHLLTDAQQSSGKSNSVFTTLHKVSAASICRELLQNSLFSHAAMYLIYVQNR